VARGIFNSQKNYFNTGDPYSEWCRTNNVYQIDVDVCGICEFCKVPLYLAETCFDKGQKWKATTSTEALAKLSGLPSFLVFYKVDANRDVESFRIKQLTPQPGKETYLLPESWSQVLELIQDQHNQTCTKKKQT
tara:strand:- start:206 stop:607 length:402 start_codon:yes stop_codon:yes gene_type:complete